MSSSTNIPSGFKPALSKFDSVFDREAINDDDKELWLIRIPDNLSEEDLASVKIKTPTNKSMKKPLAKLEKDDDKYALYKVPTASNFKSESESGDESGDNVDLGISGHEMISFDCLVPSREDGGKLTFAPKKFDQFLILNQIVDIPDSIAFAQSILDKPVYKRDQPEGLQMRFKPYGYYSGQVTNGDAEMKDTRPVDVDQSETAKKRKRVENENEDEDEDEENRKKVKKEKKAKKEKKVKKEKK
ncbi:DNA-directed RNA polymerase I, subunit RPA34.5 [Parasitella parasitica]|nr:DNA-directed RNA polymerase I, subunit RPA34.5 [Parasitella parasitica]